MKRGFLAITLLLLVLIAVHTGSNAQVTWKAFSHHNGFSVQLPHYFKKGLLVASGTLQYFDNSLDSNISVSVETFGIGTKVELQASFNSDLKLYKGISYKVLKPAWYVISGQNDEGIFYNKSIIKGGVQHHLRMQYPPAQKAIFDTLLGKISASFR
ncbi:MAG TPA: hypothetical protein VM884_06060 [Flavisolibacter sp.]|jgi:hypothetical protein|nr:hypothetical protein [Flavisolibacter sp.]